MWIFFALISRFLWASCNAVDQTFSRAHTTEKTKSVLVLSCIFELPFGFFALYLAKDISFDLQVIQYLCAAIIAHLAALVPYFYCLQKEEAYNITPFMEVTPVFLILLSTLLNNESLTYVQLLGGVLIIGSGFSFSWDFKNSKIKTSVLWPMICCCLLFAVAQFSLSLAARHIDVWHITGFMMTGNGLVGVIVFLLMPKVRQSIMTAAKKTKGGTAGMAAVSNLFSFLALASITVAFATAPSTGHVASLSGTQPFFSFLIALVLARFVPRYYEKIIFNAELKVKLGLLAFILLGIYLLTSF